MGDFWVGNPPKLADDMWTALFVPVQNHYEKRE